MKDKIDVDLEIQKAKHISKIITVTFLTIVIVIVVCFFVIKYSVKKIDVGINERTYYYILVNENNKNEIKTLLELEKENIIINTDKNIYCESIYKIEYINQFPDGTNYTVYCTKEDNIQFSIGKVENDVIHNYIYENGISERR